jgi:hypothetical protein
MPGSRGEFDRSLEAIEAKVVELFAMIVEDLPRAAQSLLALGNLQVALEESGAAIRDVVKTTVYVASGVREDLVAAWDEAAGFFGDHDVPSTLLGVAAIGYRLSAIGYRLSAIGYRLSGPACRDRGSRGRFLLVAVLICNLHHYVKPESRGSRLGKPTHDRTVVPPRLLGHRSMSLTVFKTSWG